MTRRLRALLGELHAALPPGAPVTVTLPREWVAALVESADGPRTAEDGSQGVPMTAGKVGDLLGRSAASVRAWCASGRLPGAFRLQGREWRIPRAALDRFLANAAAGRDGAEQAPDLSRWRRRKAA